MDSEEVHRQWKERSGDYSPDYYADFGPSRTSEMIRQVLEFYVDTDAAVLELGCSSGRHLAHLHEHGFENLYGIEINGDSMETMAETYPDLAADGTFYIDAIEDTVTDLDDDRFDAVYSAETLQHLPPDSGWVFAEVARITDELLLTVENEGEDDEHSSAESSVEYIDDFPLYHREWDDVFTGFGFVDAYSRPAEMDTLRVFRPAEYYP